MSFNSNQFKVRWTDNTGKDRSKSILTTKTLREPING